MQWSVLLYSLLAEEIKKLPFGAKIMNVKHPRSAGAHKFFAGSGNAARLFR